MTSSNGDRGRIVDHVDGTVAASNALGGKLVGDDEYRNFSKYTAEPIAPPRREARVRLGLDGSGFVRELQVFDQPGAGADRAREIRRPGSDQDRRPARRCLRADAPRDARRARLPVG